MPETEVDQFLERLKRLEDIVSVLSWIAKRFDRAIDIIEQQQSIDDVLRELSEYLTENVERIDNMLLLILEKLPDEQASPRVRRETAELRTQTIKSRVRSLYIQLQKHQKNLNWLEEQAANYGPNVTLEITNQITFERETTKKLQKEIDYLNQQIEVI